MKSRAIIDIIASLLILLFLYAGIRQLAFHHPFFEQLYRSLVNKPLASLLSWAIPGVQFVLVWLLGRPSTRLAGLFASLAAASLFTIYLIVMLPKAYQSRCDCGEFWQSVNVETNIVFNVMVVLLSGIAIIVSGRYRGDSSRMHFGNMAGLKKQWKQ